MRLGNTKFFIIWYMNWNEKLLKQRVQNESVLKYVSIVNESIYLFNFEKKKFIISKCDGFFREIDVDFYSYSTLL